MNMTSRCTVYLFVLGVGFLFPERHQERYPTRIHQPAQPAQPERKEDQRDGWRRGEPWRSSVGWDLRGGAQISSMECHQCYNKKFPGGVDSKRLEHLFRWVWMLEILTSEASAGPLSWKIAGKVLVNLGGWFTMVTMRTPISNKQIFVGQLFRFQTKILHHSCTQSTSHILKPPLLPPPFRGRKWVPVPGIILCSHPQYQLLCHRCHARYTLPRLCGCGECRLASGMDGTLVKFWWHGVTMGLGRKTRCPNLVLGDFSCRKIGFLA